jgi:hypothetical protein
MASFSTGADISPAACADQAIADAIKPPTAL